MSKPNTVSRDRRVTRAGGRQAGGRAREAVVVAALIVTLHACGNNDGEEADIGETSATTTQSDDATGASHTSPAATTTDRSTDTISTAEARRVEPLAKIPLDAPPGDGVVTDDAVWIGTDDETLLRVDPATNQIVQRLAAPGLTVPFDIGSGSAWIPDFDASVVRRVDLETGDVIAEIPTGEGPETVEATGDAVWVADHRSGTVTRIDPATNQVVATVQVGPAGPAGPDHLVANGDRVWVGVTNSKQVVAIDANTNHVVARIRAEMPCGPLRVLGDDLWVTSCFEDEFVDVIDTVEQDRRGTVEAGGPVGAVFEVDGLVWLTVIDLQIGHPGSLLGINPYTGQVVERLTVDDPAFFAAVGFDSVWMFSWESQAVVRLPLQALHSNG